MGRHDEFHQALFAGCRKRLHVAFEHRLKRLGGCPFGMIWRLGLHPVEREGKLDVHRMLDPQRAVIVEHRDAFGLRHEVGRTFLAHLLDELDDRSLRRGVVPGGQGIGLGQRDGRRQGNRQGTATARAAVWRSRGTNIGFLRRFDGREQQEARQCRASALKVDQFPVGMRDGDALLRELFAHPLEPL